MRIGGGTNSSSAANNNLVTLSNRAELTLAGSLHVGSNGSGGSNNSFIVGSGALATIGLANSKTISIGAGATSNNNALEVQSAGYPISELRAYSIAVGSGANTGNTLFLNGGKLQVSSALTFSAGSVFKMALDSQVLGSAGSLTIASGATFVPYISGSVYSPKRVIDLLEIKSAPTGKFTVNPNFFGPNYKLSLGYATFINTQSQYLELRTQLQLGAGLLLNPRQLELARAINDAFNTKYVDDLLPSGLGLLGSLTGNDLKNALNRVSGAVYVMGGKANFGSIQNFGSLLGGVAAQGGGMGGGFRSYAAETSIMPSGLEFLEPRSQPQKFVPQWRMWSTLQGGLGSYGATAEDPGMKTHGGGVAAGASYTMSPETVVGFSFGALSNRWGARDGSGQGVTDAFQSGVYARSAVGPVYVTGIAAMANQWMSTDRAVLTSRMTSNVAGQTYLGRLETAYPIATALGTLSPYIAGQVSEGYTPAYNETDEGGTGFGLGVKKSLQTVPKTELGLRHEISGAVGANHTFGAFLRAAWLQDWSKSPVMNAAIAAMPGSDFSILGGSPNRNAALASVAGKYAFRDELYLTAKLDAQIEHKGRSLGGSLQILYPF